jgi:hypothetical protein
MENVTGKWRFRDGREVVAVYENGRELLGIWKGGYVWVLSDSWRHAQNRSDLIPVEPETTYRPFKNLEEAFRVMGPTPWIRDKSATAWDRIVTVSSTVDGFSVNGTGHKFLFSGYVWTNDPSEKTGKPCGVEVTP